MKVFELLYLFNKHLKFSIVKFPTTARYVISAYTKVSKKITDLYQKNKSITNSDIQKLNITDNMKNKLQYLLTQKINPTEIKKLEHQQLINDLINIAGIGKTKAINLIKSGLTKISDLSKKKYKDQLNDATKLLMKYKPCRKIPHNEIKKIEKILTSFPNTQLVGSFRRKKPFSRDIDVMIVSNNNSKSNNVLDTYIQYLKTKFKEIYIYAKGNDKVSLIVSKPVLISKSLQYYKIDIFRSSIISKYAMLLYSTGSKEFNMRMRRIASRMGYLLNQHGLYKKDKLILVKSEKDFFNLLKMDYVEAHNR
jgi:DNA polymerase/3'-5' exonuclease PolX